MMTDAQRSYIEDLIAKSGWSVQSVLEDAGIRNYVTNGPATNLDQLDVAGASALLDHLLADPK